MQENENKVIFTPKVEEEGRIDEFPTITPEELQSPKLATLPVDSQELETEEKLMEGVEEELQAALDAEDLDKKNYVKISPTFYIKSIDSDKVDEEGEKIEIFQILNPKTNVVETRELTTEEKHDIMVQQLKESRIRFRSVKHGAVKTVGTSTVVSSIGRERKVKVKDVKTNITTNQFGAEYRKKRQRKNKLAKASRKANRK